MLNRRAKKVNGGSIVPHGNQGIPDTSPKKRAVRKGAIASFCSIFVLIFSYVTISSEGTNLLLSPSANYNLAKEESFGFFDDIPDDHWKRYQKIMAEVEDHLDPDDPHPYEDNTWEHYFWWYQTSYEPNFSCPFEKRVGGNGNGDGPKWVCDPHRLTRVSEENKVRDKSHPGCLVYSIGSQGDFSFELGMQREVGVGVCEYHIFDMGDYEKDMPKQLENAHYHKWGLKKQDRKSTELPKPGQEFYGLKDTVKMLGHENVGAIDVFKIDCEGCEWTTFDAWLQPDMPDLKQILIEIHKPPADIATYFFDTLQASGYARFHKEVNIICPEAGATEYSFIKLSKDFFPESKLVVKNDKYKKQE